MSFNEESSVNRREFFKNTFAEIAKTFLDFSGEKWKAPPRRRGYLRPPGAVEEGLFNALCTRCDECIKVCPHLCIRGSDSEAGMGARVGTPIIIPKEAACRLCSDFPCITVCKDGALRPVEDIRRVKIGVARIDTRRCLNYIGEESSPCQHCYVECPLRDEAIYLQDSRPVIRAERCVGCGICENACTSIIPSPAVRVFPVSNGL